MMLISIIIFRVLIAKVLNNPGKKFPSYPISGPMLDNIKTICSIVYHIFNSIIMKATQWDWKSTQRISEKWKPVHIDRYLAVDPKEIEKYGKRVKHWAFTNDDESIACFKMKNLYTFSELQAFHHNDVRWNSILNKGWEFLDKLYDLVNEHVNMGDLLNLLSTSMIENTKEKS